MVWRNRWALSIVVGLLLFAVAVAVILQDGGRYRDGVRQAFQASCTHRVAAFEGFAEDWIIRDDVRSLESAAELLILGSGLYVDAVSRGEVLVNSRREDSQPAPVDPAAIPPQRTVVEHLPEGDIEVRAPIVLTGYPDTPIGFLRIAFSGDYASEQIRRHTIIASGIGLASWLAAFSVVLAFAVQRGRKPWPCVPGSESIVCCGGLEIDTRTCDVRLNGESLDLTPKLYDLLLVFARDPGTVFSDDDLLRSVWPDSTYAASADVKQHIYLLRRKLGSVHPDPKTLLETVKGFGYRLVPSANEEELSGI